VDLVSLRKIGLVKKTLNTARTKKIISRKKVWSVILSGKGGFTQERITNKQINKKQQFTLFKLIKPVKTTLCSSCEMLRKHTIIYFFHVIHVS